MAKINVLFFVFILTSFSVRADEISKQEFIDIVSSNVEFYDKIEPGMGLKGEMRSRLVDEEGNYLNCTIALRGQYIVINTTAEVDSMYVYQNHWIDINIDSGNNCDPTKYPTDHNKFVQTAVKRKSVEGILKLLSKPGVTVDKVAEKTFMVKYVVPAGEHNDEMNVNDKYDLNKPLFMNPEANGFTHHYFDYKALDLSSISLCPAQDEEGECVEGQDLSHLIES